METVFGDRGISHNLHNQHRACTAVIVLKPQSVWGRGGWCGCGDNADERHLFIYLFIYLCDICLSKLSVKLGLINYGSNQVKPLLF